jgi:hypothetical protein
MWVLFTIVGGGERCELVFTDARKIRWVVVDGTHAY